MSHENFNEGPTDFIHQSLTPFHAVANMAAELGSTGFFRLKEGYHRATNPGRYCVSRNDSSIIAFTNSGR